MLTLLKNLADFWEKRFLIAYWCPAAVTLGALGLIVALERGLAGVLHQIEGLRSFPKVVLATSMVITIFVFAYVLQALTAPIVRLFEGYGLPRRLRREMRRDELKRKQRLQADAGGSLDRALQRSAAYWYFPKQDAFVAPTRLGNVLAAAEEYATQVYTADTALWWPRVFATLEEKFAEQVDASLLPMVALLNLSAGFGLVALAGGGYVYGAANTPWAFVAPVTGGVLLAWMCYRAAVSQAVGYGSMIRVAFDFYHLAVLEKMKIPAPGNLKDERVLWHKLGTLAFEYEPPWRQFDPVTREPYDDKLAYVTTSAIALPGAAGGAV